MDVIAKILKWPFKVIFSRTTFVILAIALQVLILIYIIKFLGNYVFLIYCLFIILSLSVVMHILNTKQNPAYKIAWIIPIILLPVFGVFIYTFVHTQPRTRKLNKKLVDIREFTKQYLKQNQDVKNLIKNEDCIVSNYVTYMNNEVGFPMYTNNDVKYFSLGEYMFDDLIIELEKAEKYIFLEFFIVDQGYMWDKILSILKKKAKQGVEVRVMYDGMNALRLLPRTYAMNLTKMGIKCKKFLPVKPFISTEQNNRDHRKIIVIDGKIAYTGGLNIADEYINKKEVYGHWKDVAVKIEGPAVQNFVIMFLEMWNVSGKKQENYEQFIVPNKQVHCEINKGFLLPFADNPLSMKEGGRRTYLSIINNAKKYIHIMTPYLVLDNEILMALIFAAQSGVDVKIIMPHIPDKKFVYYLGRSFYKDLIEAGVKIYEYTPGFVHAKLFVSDDIKSVVGTINLDYRSLYLHFECATFIYNNNVIADIEKDYQDTLTKCQKIDLENIKNYSLVKTYIGKLLKFLAPLM